MANKYHAGELEVQARAGVREMAARVSNSIRPTIPAAAHEFLLDQPILVVGSVGPGGRVWASLLAGEPGFARVLDERTVRIEALPASGDPLNDNLEESGAAVGMLAIDLSGRRRMRLNGKAEVRPEGIYVRAEQVYANCPKYIQARQWKPVKNEPDTTGGAIRRTRKPTEDQRRRISDTDTFFITSAHPEGGVDASHRGGRPGFVRFLDESTLEFPDYSGNTMFNTLGNIATNPNAGLLFVDFEGGGTLQLTGEARIVWDADRAGAFAGAERVVEFGIEEVVEIPAAVPLRWRFEAYSPFNPVDRPGRSEAPKNDTNESS